MTTTTTADRLAAADMQAALNAACDSYTAGLILAARFAEANPRHYTPEAVTAAETLLRACGAANGAPYASSYDVRRAVRVVMDLRTNARWNR